MLRPLVAVCLSLTSCLKSTPFKSDPDARDLTRQELRRLEELGEPPDAFSFVALGDTHDEYDELQRTVDLINRAGDARFALIAGDLTDRGTLQEFEWSGELYRELQLPFLTVIGNHDALSDGKTIYQRMYGPLNYSFHHGPLKFVMFDSNTLETPSAPNRDWLSEQVDDLDGARTVVLVTHQSPLAPDDLPGGTNREFYEQLLQTGNVGLVVHGHLDEQRLRLVDGIPVLQCGTYQTQLLHTFIDFDGEAFSFRSCKLDDCQPLQPEPEGELETAQEARP